MGVCERVFLVLANSCLVIMLVGNMAQITTRAVFDKGIQLVFPWTVFFFSWAVFFGFFVTVDFFIDRFGDKGRMVSRYFANAIIIFLMSIMLWHGPQTLGQMAGDLIEIVDLARWWQTFPLFLSCILVLINTLLDTAKALRGDPEPESAHSAGHS